MEGRAFDLCATAILGAAYVEAVLIRIGASRTRPFMVACFVVDPAAHANSVFVLLLVILAELCRLVRHTRSVISVSSTWASRSAAVWSAYATIVRDVLKTSGIDVVWLSHFGNMC